MLQTLFLPTISSPRGFCTNTDPLFKLEIGFFEYVLSYSDVSWMSSSMLTDNENLRVALHAQGLGMNHLRSSLGC